MEYPAEWETEFIAKNGMKIRFRPELSSDTEMLWQMFSTLSEDSVSNLIPPFTRERRLNFNPPPPKKNKY